MDKIHHVAVQVTDIALAVEWYQSQFDVEVSYVDKSWAFLLFENIGLALVLPNRHPAHFAVEQINAQIHGALTTHRDGTQSVYKADPWGNAIEYIKLNSSVG